MSPQCSKFSGTSRITGRCFDRTLSPQPEKSRQQEDTPLLHSTDFFHWAARFLYFLLIFLPALQLC
jgi:hypothetical protein